MNRGIRASFSLAGVSVLALFPAGALAGEPPTPRPADGSREIVVYGSRSDALGTVIPEDELGERDIAAYGQDTIGDLLDAISSDLDRNGEGPVVLINGELANGVSDVADLPTEAVSRLQILPRAIAARLGQSPTARVVNVVLKPHLRQLTTNAKVALSTRGDAFQGEAELNFLKLDNNNRRSLVLRAQHGDPLLESERDIRPDIFGIPFDRVGNVIALGATGGEIAPALSALVGTPVTAAGIPAGIDSPTLGDFALLANRPNAGGAADARTLVNASNFYSANGNITQRFGKQTTLMVNAKVDRVESDALLGLTSALLELPANSPYSPFGRDVSLALLVGDPLRGRQRSTGVDLATTLNTRLKAFTISARANWTHRVADVLTARDYDLTRIQDGLRSGTVNPFLGIPANLLGAVRVDHSQSRSDSAGLQLIASGPLFKMPAGMVQLTATLKARFDRFASETQGSFARSRSFSRDETGVQGNLMIPLLPVGDRDLGRLSLDLNGAVRRVSGAGTLHDYGAALNWQVGPALTLIAAYNREEVPPPAYALNDPTIVTENYRAFDLIRGDTVLVRYITGGNADLPVQTRRTTSVGATFRPFANYDLNLNIQYTRVDSRNVFAALPPVSAAIQAAFPDRFVRDADGILVQIDARPVSFVRDDSRQIRWGISFRRTFGGTALEDDEAAPVSLTRGRGVRVNLDIGDTWNLSSVRQARETLPVIDLLGGGAIGYGGGLLGHLVTFGASVATRGVGAQLDGSWRSRSFLTSGTATAPSRITFDGRFIFNARVFANLGPLMPEERWAKGLRLSLQVANMFDSRQYVTDESGMTPLRYQAFLIDQVGRSVTFGIRKAF